MNQQAWDGEGMDFARPAALTKSRSRWKKEKKARP